MRDLAAGLRDDRAVEARDVENTLTVAVQATTSAARAARPRWYRVATGQLKARSADGDPDWWMSFIGDAIAELRRVLCNKNAHGKQKRALSSTVTAVAASAGATLHVGVAGTAIGLILLGIALRMGRDAFCERAAKQLEDDLRRRIGDASGWNDPEPGPRPKKPRARERPMR